MWKLWKDRISVHICSVFVLVARVWVYCWIFSKQNSSVLCTHVLVASHWAVTRYMLVTQNVAFLQRLLQLQFPRDLFDLVVFLWWVINFVRNYSTSQHLTSRFCSISSASVCQSPWRKIPDLCFTILCCKMNQKSYPLKSQILSFACSLKL